LFKLLKVIFHIINSISNPTNSTTGYKLIYNKITAKYKKTVKPVFDLVFMQLIFSVYSRFFAAVFPAY